MSTKIVSRDGSQLKIKSPAEFFAEQRNIAGFDNAGKSLYTTLRELVENGLDASESILALPNLDIKVDEINRSQLHDILGIETNIRNDMSLYLDSVKSRAADEKLLFQSQQVPSSSTSDPSGFCFPSSTPVLVHAPSDATEPSSSIPTTSAAAASTPMSKRPEDFETTFSTPSTPSKSSSAKLPGTTKRGTLYYRISVNDNGCGMPHDAIPDMMGRVLAGTKYGVRQTRGKFGLGAKMALIWSKMSTGMPITIRSSTVGDEYVSVYVLDIDIHRNIPHVQSVSREKRVEGESNGTQVSLVIEGNWSSYRAKIIQYLREMAIITPYAEFSFQFTSQAAGSGKSRDFSLQFVRRSDSMPPLAKEIQHHPSSVNLLLVRSILSETKCKTMQSFLSTEFSSINHSHAGRLLNEIGISPSLSPHSLHDRDTVKLVHLFHEAKFATPSATCLSPAGEYNLRLGILKELQPSMIATHTEKPSVLDGHPFLVEAAVSLGGVNVPLGINVYRFANRIPLLFEGGGDVVTRCATKRIKWNSYHIRHTTDKIGVFVSLVSTRIPFKGTGKEYVGDDIPPLVDSVTRALRACCAQLRVKLKRSMSSKKGAGRKKVVASYVPVVAGSVFRVLSNMAEVGSSKRDGIIDQVSKGSITLATLNSHLFSFVENIDAGEALEAAARKNSALEGSSNEIVVVSNEKFDGMKVLENGELRSLWGELLPSNSSNDSSSTVDSKFMWFENESAFMVLRKVNVRYRVLKHQFEDDEVDDEDDEVDEEELNDDEMRSLIRISLMPYPMGGGGDGSDGSDDDQKETVAEPISLESAVVTPVPAGEDGNLVPKDLGSVCVFRPAIFAEQKQRHRKSTTTTSSTSRKRVSSSASTSSGKKKKKSKDDDFLAEGWEDDENDENEESSDDFMSDSSDGSDYGELIKSKKACVSTTPSRSINRPKRKSVTSIKYDFSDGGDDGGDDDDMELDLDEKKKHCDNNDNAAAPNVEPIVLEEEGSTDDDADDNKQNLDVKDSVLVDDIDVSDTSEDDEDDDGSGDESNDVEETVFRRRKIVRMTGSGSGSSRLKSRPKRSVASLEF